MYLLVPTPPWWRVTLGILTPQHFWLALWVPHASQSEIALSRDIQADKGCQNILR